jgi:arginase
MAARASAAALTIFQGRCGDRNDRAMRGAARLGAAVARRMGTEAQAIGAPLPPLAAHWRVELEAARPDLSDLSDRLDRLLGRGRRPITIMGRCASALATLPVVARHRPDAAIVWLDAHADSNLPATTTTFYLGGLVLTGASGRWATDLGGDLEIGNVVLAGARDIDPTERALIDAGILRHVPLGRDFDDRLRETVSGRPVYVHLDCDVLEPGIVPTEYEVPGGMTIDGLRRAATLLAQCNPIGLEIAEFEAEWAGTGLPGDPDLVAAAMEPLLASLG